ncbi:hypothetical protein FOG18_08985 [Legionella israelensis]|uniref:outer membrane protein n=1 Tax=Legionella israelensis TaxID=454 RepID=UPI00117D9325|nr:hypothetical protein [Legionella israelensis]QDP72679.1 hypothetical protein FOG18_08985 [Legionella israelensis]
MTVKRLIKPFFLSIFSVKAIAGGMYDDTAIGWTKVITLSGGPAWSRAGETQTLYLNSVLSNRYNAQKDTRLMGTGEIFFALQGPFAPGILGQLGIAAGGTGEAKMQGTIDVNFIPSGSRYEYRTNHWNASIRGKLLTDPRIFFIQPYITAAIGAAFNYAYGFRTIPLISPLTSSQWFDSNTKVGFTYSIGGGIQTSFNDHWQVGVGYEFSDWGKSELGRALTIPWTHTGPQLDHIYAHNVLFSLSYLC